MKNGEIAKTVIETISELEDRLYEDFKKDPQNSHIPDDMILMMAISELLKKIKAPTSLIDKMVLRHIKQGNHFLDVRNNLNKAIEFAKLGASVPILEKLTVVLAERGHLSGMKVVREHLLKSLPTKKEVFLLLKSYNDGAVQSDTEEKMLRSLARETLSSKDFHKFQTLLEERRERFQNQVD